MGGCGEDAEQKPRRADPAGLYGCEGLVQNAVEQSVARVLRTGRVHDREALPV